MTNSTVETNNVNTEVDMYEELEDLQPRNLRNCLNRAREIMSRKDKREFLETSNTKRAAKRFSFRNTRYTEEY